MEISFCELRKKEVVSVTDGKKLGRIVDLKLGLESGRILAIVVPGERSMNIFRPPEDVVIPWQRICRIGDDVILVNVGACGVHTLEVDGESQERETEE